MVDIKHTIFNELEINIQEEPGYDFDSTDNKHYDEIIKTEEGDFTKFFSFEISNGEETKTVLLIVSYHTPSDSFVENHPEGLFLMLNDTLCVLNPRTLSLEKKVKLSPIGTMFEVHRYGNDYILYGETEIYRVNADLDVIWVFSGRDIFVKYADDGPAFEMKDDRICLYDFEDSYYEIDYDGKLLKERLNIG